MIQNKKPRKQDHRGGARRGAGRPARDGVVATLRYTVTLDEATVLFLTQLGGGNLSEGIRVGASTLARLAR